MTEWFPSWFRVISHKKFVGARAGYNDVNEWTRPNTVRWYLRNFLYDSARKTGPPVGISTCPWSSAASAERQNTFERLKPWHAVSSSMWLAFGAVGSEMVCVCFRFAIYHLNCYTHTHIASAAHIHSWGMRIHVTLSTHMAVAELDDFDAFYLFHSDDLFVSWLWSGWWTCKRVDLDCMWNLQSFSSEKSIASINGTFQVWLRSDYVW